MNRATALLISRLPMGFITSAQMPELIALEPLQPCLVRCGGKRFTCGAQDVAEMIRAVEMAGDYVRDVSIPSVDYRAAVEMAKLPAPVPAAKLVPAFVQTENSVKPSEPRLWLSPDYFDESQCGGVFDGHGVISDADPGL